MGFGYGTSVLGHGELFLRNGSDGWVPHGVLSEMLTEFCVPTADDDEPAENQPLTLEVIISDLIAPAVKPQRVKPQWPHPNVCWWVEKRTGGYVLEWRRDTRGSVSAIPVVAVAAAHTRLTALWYASNVIRNRLLKSPTDAKVARRLRKEAPPLLKCPADGLRALGRAIGEQ